MGIAYLVHDVKPKNITTARPGRVGSVGEVIVRTRFRQSCAEMPWSYDPYWNNKRSSKLGSNVQDGNTKSFDSGGGPAAMNTAFWNGNRSFKHAYGYSMHDVRPVDTSKVAIDSELPQFSWRRQVARTRNVRGGTLFMPMGYRATGKPRGGLYPTSTAHGGVAPASVPFDPENAEEPNLGVDGPNPQNQLREGPTRRGVQKLGARLGNLNLGSSNTSMRP